MTKGQKANYLILLFLFLLCFFKTGESQPKKNKILTKPLVVRDAKTLDANQISMWMMNSGSFCRNPVTGNKGLEYPIHSGKYAVYAAGLWVAGKVNGEVRTACADYNIEYQGGIILPTGLSDDPSLEKYRLYKIKPGDSSNPLSPNYNIDYAEWPIADGAPVNEYGDPLIIGDQTIWFVMNDGNSTLHGSCYGTEPLKIEVRVLAWAFDDDMTPLGKTVFVYYNIINKSEESITDAYVGIFADADLGGANDDRAACDTTRNLSYVFNGNEIDAYYGAQVPAVGVCLLQGPVIPSPGQEAVQFLHEPKMDSQVLNITSHSNYY